MPEFVNTPHWRVSTKQRTRARALRRNTTDAERIIWNSLRAKRLAQVNFRRQTPIGPYIVDFVCHEAQLIVEIDGGQHFESQHEKRDARRDAFLATQGYRVIRFSNLDVMSNRYGVLESIAAAVVDSLSPPLPRKRGREQSTPHRKIMPQA
jgi:very-short-patch-repair endonuclease